MTRLQRAERFAYWRGSALALLIASLWMLASGLRRARHGLSLRIFSGLHATPFKAPN
ncbi:hypothetical protein ACTUVN_002635 [Pseudomonas caspiana]